MFTYVDLGQEILDFIGINFFIHEVHDTCPGRRCRGETRISFGFS
jgi:hypothetical protein